MSKIKPVRNGTRKDTIIRKAAALFRKKGFVATSMREIADNIGVEASSLYNHIGSKSELLQSICFQVANAFNQQLEEVEQMETPTAKKLESLIRFHIRMMLDNFDEVYVANHEWKQLGEPFLSNFLAQRKQYEGRLVELVTTGIRKKELKNIHPHVAVLSILSAVRGLEFWQRHKKEPERPELENNLVNYLLHGITR
ncbi:MAG TPA: TetR/AcrR family transcriptional regulator [Chitinophagaceae bacterium]|nr:TetR/AcrR family transcriptional regulator [Chitinophagaceae bacterium]